MHRLSYENLAGHWQRVSQTPADPMLYPERIEFRQDGSYLTPMDNSAFYEWQAGDFEVVNSSTINIQASNDAMLGYQCSLINEELTFTDAEGIEVRYRRL